MKIGAIRHPKTLGFKSRLQVSLPTALGHLELLWAFVGEHAPQGNVGKWSDEEIAGACDWPGEPTAFVTALASAGFIDRDPAHRWLIHDWKDHAPRWVLSKLSRAHLTILESQCTADSSNDCSPDCSPDSSGDSVRLGSGRVGSTRESEGAHAPPTTTRARTATRIPDDFVLTDARRQVAVAERVEPERTFAKFSDYWRAVSGAKARKLDWDATWRNWCRTEADRSRGTGPRLAGPMRQRAKTTEELEAMERARAQ